MNSRKTFYILLVLLCSGVNIYSQKHIGNFEQLFLKGTKTPVPNFDTFLLDAAVDRDEIVDGYFYRFVQFNAIPTEDEQRDIEDAGIVLLDYIPHKTYLAAIPEDYQRDLIEPLNIRNITPLEIEDKLSPTLFSQEKIILQYFKNLTPDFVQTFLQNKNIEIFEFRNNANAVVICTNSSEYATIANFTITQFLEPAETDVFPEYTPGKNLHRSNVLTPFQEGFAQYNGEGVNIAVGDDGMIAPHIDLQGRIQQDAVIGDTDGTHGEMVTGILAGAGNLDPLMEGTASHATIHMYHEFEAVKQIETLHANKGIVITSTSYSDGCNRGYTSFAQLADYQLKNNSSIMHVFSAGNTGNENCGYGAGEGWGNITGGVKMGKNVLTVANVDVNDNRVSSSSRGPASDGRIKPDISAIGNDQYSTQPNHTYGEASGSSAAAPGVAGVLAQLYQAWQSTHDGSHPNSALVKAALLNSADDLGNPGPDFSHGWGRVNARRALGILQSENYFEGSLNQGGSHTHFMTVPNGTQQVRVMLYWHDAAGSPISKKSLVNDLDLNVMTPDGAVYLPWVLQHSPNPTVLDLPATRGNDDLNNVEQITVDAPANGLFTLTVKGAEVPHGIQDYFVVYEFLSNDITVTYPMGGEKSVPGETERIHWDAYGDNGTFAVSASYNNGNTWQLIDQVAGNKRSLDWTVGNTHTSQAIIRVSRNGTEGMSQIPFTIYEVPQNLVLAQACPSSIRLEWDEVANATSYNIFRLGEKYMEYYSSTPDPFIDIPVDSPNEQNWFAVQAQGVSNLVGRRSIAINDGTALFNCALSADLSMHSLSSPANATQKSCFTAPTPVSINITNTGTEIQQDFPVYYQLNDEPAVGEMYTNAIPPNVTVNFIFNNALPNLPSGTYQLKTWTDMPSDQARFNDTLFFELNVIPSELEELPYFQNFDNFSNCSPNTDCDAVCNLSNGWNNDQNQISDDIDWLVHNGPTTSPETGPQNDQNTNNAFGKYLFLEGSMGCTEQDAYLLSPCFDLENTVQPVFSFWYHMKGIHQGRFHVDLFDGENWVFNIIPTLIGEQGNDWQEAAIDLTPFVSKIVNIRFRGITGEDYLTDLAIDNVAVFDAQSPPYPNFKADQLITCTSQKVQLQDNSVNSPTHWSWSFEPSNISFTDGTTANDANPIVIFNETGFYNITLTAGNNFGDATITRTQYIEVNNGTTISFGDDFETNFLNQEKWIASNPDNNIGWALNTTIGRDGEPTKAAFVNNYSYNTAGETDMITSKVIDLSTTTEPYLRFDWAYAAYNENFGDGLKVVLSSNCGAAFEHILFEKEGNDLATVAHQSSSWSPQYGHEWETAEIDLSAFIGNSVVVRFINTNGFGNNLYLDNFLVYENADFPNADFISTPSGNILCIGESMTFTDNSYAANTLLWNFGENATPNTALSTGPHNITFDTPGTYHVLLKAKNNLGYEVAEQTVEVLDDPFADFSYTIQNNQVVFDNHSIYGTSFFWDFGDGTTSDEKSPTHTYSHSNAFTAQLIVVNKCGQSMTDQTIIVITGTEDLENNFFLTANPNPTFGEIVFNMPVKNQQSVLFDLIDLRGVVLSSSTLVGENNLISHHLDLSELAHGIYFARVQVDNQVFVRRLVKI